MTTSYGVSADGLGNVYISGYTGGSLGGPNAGGNDAFVSKYDAAGNFQWTRQLGTSASDLSYGVSADGLGNVYFSGYTLGSLGGPNAGGDDAFVVKIVDSVVPEPSTLLLLCFGSLAVLWRRRPAARDFRRVRKGSEGVGAEVELFDQAAALVGIDHLDEGDAAAWGQRGQNVLIKSFFPFSCRAACERELRQASGRRKSPRGRSSLAPELAVRRRCWRSLWQ